MTWVGDKELTGTVDLDELQEEIEVLKAAGATKFKLYVVSKLGGWGDTYVISLNGYK